MISQPASVIEFSISSVQTPYIVKIYKIYEQFESTIGLSYMTANNDFIVHSIYDSISNFNILRVYSRNETRSSILVSEYILP